MTFFPYPLYLKTACVLTWFVFNYNHVLVITSFLLKNVGLPYCLSRPDFFCSQPVIGYHSIQGIQERPGNKSLIKELP